MLSMSTLTCFMPLSELVKPSPPPSRQHSLFSIRAAAGNSGLQYTASKSAMICVVSFRSDSTRMCLPPNCLSVSDSPHEENDPPVTKRSSTVLMSDCESAFAALAEAHLRNSKSGLLVASQRMTMKYRCNGQGVEVPQSCPHLTTQNFQK